ncbi:hypothetical protein TRFO_08700 [Tritrichomonas foetus]|uniref:Uncharacterized protein n=1 Tax=Tritrichomonas foetus TaxID=1144522 RepID=A0A1J4JMC2_9EUKA|nr:hypothetical protein TRFO_08700 [Tritrichomonas foetus]|eukprot:OHS98715.1 hypothetical protein TRFO_08700 [Tritrichomonas foetus]
MFASSDFSGIASFTHISWSHFSPICAIIPSDQRVHFFDDKGNELPNYSISKSARATAIAFSPISESLAVGWNDGTITLWRNGSFTDAPQVHKGPVNLICWHPNCPYFLSTSEDGSTCCWDTSSIILPVFKGFSDAVFTTAVWCPNEIPFAFLASSEGGFFTFENSQETLKEICTCPKPIHVLKIVPATRRVVVVSGDNYLSQYNLPPNVSKYTQVKLPVGDPPHFTTLRSDTLAYAISDTIYICNFQSDETQILRTKNGQKVTSLHWSDKTGELFATTIDGNMLIWKTTMKGLVGKLGWSSPIETDLGIRVENAIWSNYKLCFSSQTSGRRPFAFTKYDYHPLACKDFLVWQKSSNVLITENSNETKLNSPIIQSGMTNRYLMFNSSSQCNLYNMHKGNLTPFSTINNLNTEMIAIKDEVIFDCMNATLEVRNLQGTVKETMGLSAPGKFLTLNGRYLSILSEDFTIFLLDVQRRSPKLQFSTLFTTEYEMIRISSISLSCGGFCLSITVDYFKDGIWLPSPLLYLHSPQFDKTVTLQFEGRVPKCHKWDTEDPRLLCVMTVPFDTTYECQVSGAIVIPLFVADNLETFKQTPLSLESDLEEIWNVELPRIFHSKPNEQPKATVLPQFEGLDNADEASKKALMELNFHLATGDIDSAFNAIRGIDNKATWRSLAQTCAQMRRIDLADLCFGKMEDGGSAIMLHRAADDPVLQNVVVDTQLGMYEEAKTIAKDNRRFDILARIHRSLGENAEALNVANSGDRIHLKSLSFENARSAEIHGDIEAAIKLYESAGTIHQELPRLALQNNDLPLLFSYVADRTPAEVHPNLLLWFGRFYEAHQQIDTALQYYDYAHASSESVRLLCCSGRWEEAAQIAKRSNKRATICCYARLLIDKIDHYIKNNLDNEEVIRMQHEVIELFRMARQFSQAMDIALKYELVDDILALSFSAPPPLVCRAASWFEEKREAKNAILLYSRCGRLNRALALCFAMKQYDALDEISDSLNSKTDPQVLIRCGRYFIDSERWSKAAQCLAFAKQFDEVIELCNKHSIKLQSNVIQELSEIQADPKILSRFAELCEQQGEFSIAATLYVKLKDHLASMKALIRSGDTGKVIKFANLVKRRETFILAANYLQTLNPRESQPMFQQIVQLYTKAKAPDKLARFYEAAAQVEIDEYQEYQKGFELIKKARSVLEKIDGVKNKEQILANMNKKIEWIEKYLTAIEKIKAEPKKGLQICVELLRAKGIENCLRPDDIYIVMVQCYVSQGNYQNAHKILDDLRKSGSDITWYMDVSAIQKIYKEVGETFDASAVNHDDEVEYDEVDDEVVEDIQDDDF